MIFKALTAISLTFGVLCWYIGKADVFAFFMLSIIFLLCEVVNALQKATPKSTSEGKK